MRAARAENGSGGSCGNGGGCGNDGSCGSGGNGERGGNGGLCQSPWTLTKCGDAIIDDCEL